MFTTFRQAPYSVSYVATILILIISVFKFHLLLSFYRVLKKQKHVIFISVFCPNAWIILTHGSIAVWSYLLDAALPALLPLIVFLKDVQIRTFNKTSRVFISQNCLLSHILHISTSRKLHIIGITSDKWHNNEKKA